MTLVFCTHKCAYTVFFALFLAQLAGGQTPTTLTLFRSPNPANLGEAVTLTATISPAGAAGKVTFYDGSTILGIRSLSGVQATVATVLLPSGSRTLRGYYSGDGTYAPSSTAVTPQSVVAGPSLGFKADVNYAVGSNAYLSTVADFNGDGRQDIAVSIGNGTAVQIFLGNGNGTFQAALSNAISGSSLAAGDFNGDGNTDLAVGTATTTIRIALGNGNGTFQVPQTVAGLTGTFRMAVGDFNADGKADLAVTSSASTVGILLGNGNGTFQNPVSYATPSAPNELALGDFNGDGKTDVVAACPGTNFIAILKGNGDGTLQATQNFSAGTNANYLATGDLNGDGKLDVAATSSSSYPAVISSLLGNGDGTLQAVTTLVIGQFSGVTSLTLADLGGDGKLDAFSTSSGNGPFVSAGNGDGTFQAGQSISSPVYGYSGVVGEFNGDSKADLAYTFYSNNSLIVRLGGAIPDLNISITNGNGFTQGQAAAYYSLSVSNIGDLLSTGAVGVIGSLPAGMTATSIAGTGWTCLLGTLTCTRSDSLTIGSSYPPVKITINIAGNLTGNVTANGVVSGGGDGNNANNAASLTSYVRSSVTTNLTTSPQPSLFGQLVTLTATVSSGTGKVTFYDGTTVLGAGTLSGNQAVFSTALLTSGVHSLTARYVGDATYGPSLSFIRPHTVSVLSSNGFRPGTSWTGGVAIAGGDFNQDGKPDILSSNGTLLRGNGDGTFQSITSYVLPSGSSAQSAVTGDFNADGKTDFVLPSSSIYFFAGNGDGTFQSSQTISVSAGAYDGFAVDIDQDGRLDLVTTVGGLLSVFLGNGNGTFQAPVINPLGAGAGLWAVSDFNNDGKPDVAVSDGAYTSSIRVLLGIGDGSFQTPIILAGIGIYPNSLVAGDFNTDGKQDIGATYWVGAGVMLGNGDGTFQAAVSTPFSAQSPPWNLTLPVDVNGDGKLDIPYRGYYGPSVQLVFGNGNGTFQPQASGIPTDSYGGNFIAADFNADGRLDLAVANWNNGGSVNVFLGGQFSGLGIAFTHNGRLTAGQTKTYQIKVSNPGFITASGPVTVSVLLPPGLTSSAFVGEGWNCVLNTSTCTRSDGLPGGTSFPLLSYSALASAGLSPITLTPSAFVNWSGITNSAADPTAIVSPTTTSLSVSPNPATQGQTVTLTATVSSGGGTVTFYDGATVLGSSIFPGGFATLLTNQIPSGLRKISATYSGDSTHGTSKSAATSLTVNAGQSSGLVAAASPATGISPWDLAMRDLNEDGKADLVTVNSTANSISVLLGNGNGTFQPKTDYAVGAQPISIVLADFTGDRKPDVAVANATSNTISILLNTGTGAFSLATSIALTASPGLLAASDFDSDGKIDLVVNESSNTTVLFGKGDGTFAPRPNPQTTCCSPIARVADFNGDGKADLLAGNILLGDGEGTFQSVGYLGYSSYGMEAADINKDGKVDVIFNNYNGTSQYLGNGDGTFLSPITTTGANSAQGLAISDVNGDGKLDIITAENNLNRAAVWFGAGDGTFPNFTTYTAGTSPRAVVAGDFNNDGRTDLAIANSQSNNITVLLGVLTPVLSVTKTHTGDFFRGQSGAAYSITVSNGGPGITSGTVTVTDILPVGLTATAISGTGWTCVLSTKSCARSDTLAAAASYPSIVLVVNVAVDAALLIVNEADASGGGSPTAVDFDATTILTSATQGFAARAVFRDTSGGIRMTSFPSATLSNLGGVFPSSPTAAEAPGGNVFVTARDGSNALWSNVYNQGTQTWAGWQFAGGQIQGVPSITAASSGTGWIAARDAYNAYWLLSYNGSNYGSWIPLAGVFATDPVITACGDGSLYLVGKDNYNALWSGRYIPGTGFQGFQLGGGVVQGKPSVTCGNDNAAYIVVRDNSNSNWMARVSGNTWTGWFNGGAVTSIDPRIAALGGSLAVVILDNSGSVYRMTFTEGAGNGWQSWTSVGGVLSDIAPAAVSGELYFVGRAPDTSLWWWRQSGNQWTGIGNAGIVSGTLASAPR